MTNVIEFPVFTKYGPTDPKERRRLATLFRGRTVEEMRKFWDGLGGDSFYDGPEGSFDCADIHGYMNMIGDGRYCAV